MQQEARLPENSIAKAISIKLTEAFKPAHLDVIDESHLHAGHAGARPEGETHFRVIIVTDKFDGQNRVNRHRQVNEVLADELKGRVHALAISARTPEEAATDA